MESADFSPDVGLAAGIQEASKQHRATLVQELEKKQFEEQRLADTYLQLDEACKEGSDLERRALTSQATNQMFEFSLAVQSSQIKLFETHIKEVQAQIKTCTDELEGLKDEITQKMLKKMQSWKEQRVDFTNRCNQEGEHLKELKATLSIVEKSIWDDAST